MFTALKAAGIRYLGTSPKLSSIAAESFGELDLFVGYR